MPDALHSALLTARSSSLGYGISNKPIDYEAFAAARAIPEGCKRIYEQDSKAPLSRLLFNQLAALGRKWIIAYRRLTWKS